MPEPTGYSNSPDIHPEALQRMKMFLVNAFGVKNGAPNIPNDPFFTDLTEILHQLSVLKVQHDTAKLTLNTIVVKSDDLSCSHEDKFTSGSIGAGSRVFSAKELAENSLKTIEEFAQLSNTM